jgi:hypothetical protein
MDEPFMVYFGPWKESGHFFFYENGGTVYADERKTLCWKDYEIDGVMQPGCPDPNDRLKRRTRPMVEGEALLHHKDGWTALSFWDSSVDTRPGSTSTYIAKGIFTFEEMVQLAKTRFAERWNKMTFQVKLVSDNHQSSG